MNQLVCDSGIVPRELVLLLLGMVNQVCQRQKELDNPVSAVVPSFSLLTTMFSLGLGSSATPAASSSHGKHTFIISQSLHIGNQAHRGEVKKCCNLGLHLEYAYMDCMPFPEPRPNLDDYLRKGLTRI